MHVTKGGPERLHLKTTSRCASRGVPDVPSVSSVPSPQSSPPAHSSQSDVPPDAAVPLPDSPPGTCPPVPDVSSVSNPARSASEIAQQPVETSPASVKRPTNLRVHV